MPVDSTKLSVLCAIVLLTQPLQAKDYVNIQMLYYDENDETTTIVSPNIELNIDLSADYTLNASLGMDALTGASETYYDKSYTPSSGASPYKHAKSNPSAYARGKRISQNDVGYGLIDYRDYRYSASVSLTKRLANRDELTGGLSYNNEYDFHIPEISLGYKHWLDPSKNSALTLSAAYQYAYVLIWCRNNTLCDTKSGASETFHQNNLFTQLTYTQVIDKRSEAEVTLFYNDENGFLSNPYKNIVRDYNTAPLVTNERRPDNRQGYGTKLSYHRAVTDKTTLHGSYRYYHDDWELDAHTLSTTLYHQYTPKLTLQTTLRYYTQSKASFYDGRKDHFTDEKYASSDIRLGDLHSLYIQGGIDYRMRKDLIQNFYLSYYKQNNGLKAISFVIGQKYLF
ncbi:MAG: hypothetical protein DSZ05_05240 [Sulfurospirillum sp.]|nr:MAG: hypothetical protein DSZ05_05240 [Sulfurospirillum sp.]